MTEATHLSGDEPHSDRSEKHSNMLPYIVGAMTDTPASDVEHALLDEAEARAVATSRTTDQLAPADASAETPRAPRLLSRAGLRARVGELAKFGSVGAVSFVVDIGVFNLLRFGPGDVLHDKPITAKVISVTLATLVAWIGNRQWTFSERRSQNMTRELVGFAVINVGGMLIAIGCLWFSHYVLGLTSGLADNIAANVVGLVLGTIFRYFAYRHLVFTGRGAGASTSSS
jgi:putative flippase GtrA